MHIQKFAQKAIVLNKLGEVLLIKYSSSKYTATKVVGKYGLSGGKIEFGQTPDESIMEEVKEETGIVCRPGTPIYCWNWEYAKDNDQIQINAIARICDYVSGDINSAKEELETTLESHWVSIKNILDLDIVWDERPALEIFLKNYEFYSKFLAR